MKFITGVRPGDDLELTPAIAHKRVVRYLSKAEQKQFKNLTPNKIAVVSLYYEVLNDYLPGMGSMTYRLFGYSKLHELDHVGLLGLYQGLIPRLGCKIKDFMEAYEKGQLCSLIQSWFSRLPQGSRGGYYEQWFPGKEELFTSLKPPDSIHGLASVVSKMNKLPSFDLSDFAAYNPWPDVQLFRTCFRPGDSLELTLAKLLTPNKIAVVALYHEVFHDSLPAIGSSTYSLFGYSNLTEQELPSLLGLYQGLISILGCKVGDFLNAYEHGTLFSLIQSKFSQLPESSRGDYYKWFCGRRELFDGLKPRESANDHGVPKGRKSGVAVEDSSLLTSLEGISLSSPTMAQVAPSEFAATAWPDLQIKTEIRPGDDLDATPAKIHQTVVRYLSEDEMQDFQNMTPNKIAVVGLYYEVLKDYLPAIDSTTYRLFGYSKLHELDQPCLLGLYQGLISCLECKIEDFLQAYENGELYSLIESRFSQLKQSSRGSYYGWFRERKELFDDLKPPDDSSTGGLLHGKAIEEAKMRTCHVCDQRTTTGCSRCRKVMSKSRLEES